MDQNTTPPSQEGENSAIPKENNTSFPTKSDKANIIIYSIVIVLIFIALGCSIFLFTFVKSQGSSNNTAYSTKPTPTQISTTVPANSTAAPKSAQQAINDLNNLQTVVNNNANNENTDYSSLNSSFATANQGSTEQSSLNSL